MTVSYSRLVANGSSFGCFWPILFKWRGSVYKLVWRELFFYLLIYFCINLTYRYAMNENQQRIFEMIRQYFYKHSENIPMAFVLGFYVTLVVKRWWEQYRLLPWPDTLALFVSAAIPGVDERGRLMRRNIVRYAVLAYVITLKHVSVRVKKRFPTLQHIVDAGLMMESEKKIFELMDERHPMAKYWLPLTWATNIINRARKENLIQSDHMVQTLLTEMSDMRWRLGSLIGYDNVTVPLVYTQVVTLSVYFYFLAALIGRQFVTPSAGESLIENIDVYFPFVTALQFCFYIGWLKVAEVLIGPFGEDDDDIELNWLIDRHIKNSGYGPRNCSQSWGKLSSSMIGQKSLTVPPISSSSPTVSKIDVTFSRTSPSPFFQRKAAYMIVDEMHEEHPELLKDQYWDEVVPKDLPYTVASEHYRRHEPKGSAEFFKVKDTEALYANLQHRKSLAPDDVYADYESVDTPMVERRKNWFQRQVQRMSSVRRSSSTTYSSGLFGANRSRHNSVYATPNEGGGLPGQYPQPPPPVQHKMSIYDRIIRRKSTRRGPGKLNVNMPPSGMMKTRPRIPTPDVTKDPPILDKDNKLIFPSYNNNNHHVANGSVSNNPQSSSALVLTDNGPQLMQMGIGNCSQNINRVEFRTARQQVEDIINGGRFQRHVAYVLLPIAEADGNQSTITSTASTAALAQAVLSPSLKSAGLQAVITQPVAVTTVGQTPSMALAGPILPIITTTGPPSSSPPGVKITEIVEDSGCGSSSGSSPSASGDDRSRKTSTTSQRRGEVYV